MNHYEKAKQNGLFFERLCGYGNPITLLDDPLLAREVKSCQEWQEDAHAFKGRRRGRFVFDSDQHEELLRRNGEYLLIVHREGKVIQQKAVPAREIDFLVNGRRKVKWVYFFVGCQPSIY